MILKKLNDLEEFVAGDKTLLKEVFHPKNGDPETSYSIAFATIAPGKASLPHRLQSSELYLIINGVGEAIINGARFNIEAGTCMLVTSNEEQYLRNTGTTALSFFCIVDPPWKEAEEVVIS